ncbi:MAG: hypothetical protein GWN86_19475, partial [Desulfobacterales bacterium]|nr:hypothetical protein [Desulfobacterales bacterium]NIV68508.1 hypothetical protein [Candidatus Bathyarchaeota archaeon]
VKPGGFIGAVELAWKQEPPSSIINMVQKVLCSASINAAEHEEWSTLFHSAGIVRVSSELRDLAFEIRDLFMNEGILKGLKAMYKIFFEPVPRERMKGMRELFKESQKYLGYGLYTGRVT